MSVSRREFLSGAAALGLGGWRLFAAPLGWKHGGKPNLVFGVVSDTHLRTRHGSSGKPGHNWPDKYFAAALEYFKRRGVDAVVHCGDMAHRGQVEEMQFHANAWNRVFGPSCGPVKLFVTGNHDAEGAGYGDFVEKNYPDPAERAKHVLATDMAANWERTLLAPVRRWPKAPPHGPSANTPYPFARTFAPPPHFQPHQPHIPTIEGRGRQRRLKLWYNISAFSEEDVGLRNRAGGPSKMMLI